MAKSHASFNKREIEKRKEQRRKEKQQRREERKAMADQSTDFDDMIAYVDEFGNITDTPPDPAEIEKVDIEDIEISVPKKEPIDPSDLIRKGTVTFFNQSKGYGFIRDLNNQESIFFHVNGLIDTVGERDRVTFETEMGLKGLNAINVRLESKEE